jgi:hypothetical protein
MKSARHWNLIRTDLAFSPESTKSVVSDELMMKKYEMKYSFPWKVKAGF